MGRSTLPAVIQFKAVFDAIRELMTPLEPKKKRPIGFAPWVSNSAQYFPLISVQFFPLCQPFEPDFFDA